MESRICMIRTGLIVFFITFLGILLSGPMDTTPYDRDDAYATDPCITYDSAKRLISIGCKSARLSDIDNQLHNSTIITRESGIVTETKTNESTDSSKNWILRAGIVVKENATFVVDSKDTSWLKIVPVATKQLLQAQKLTTAELDHLQPDSSNDSRSTGTDREDFGSITRSNIDTDNDINKHSQDDKGNQINENVITMVSKNNNDNPNGIHVYGSLIIDSVKITSWDPQKNDVIKFDLGKRAGEELTKSNYDTIEPRPFIRVSEKATGTTKIINSELSYLGYSCSRCSGISFYGGNGSILKGNDIHHLLKGFYSNGMGHMTIEGNHFHDNYLYGIDPHTGTHDIIIRDNVVHDNNASGIICSKYCFNILIEGNEVYKNNPHGSGIMFSIHMYNSTARNNHVHNQIMCMSFDRSSSYNKVYDNAFSDCGYAINLANTTNNQVYNNTVRNSINGIAFQNMANIIKNNKFANTTNGLVVLKRRM